MEKKEYTNKMTCNVSDFIAERSQFVDVISANHA